MVSVEEIYGELCIAKHDRDQAPVVGFACKEGLERTPGSGDYVDWSEVSNVQHFQAVQFEEVRP